MNLQRYIRLRNFLLVNLFVRLCTPETFERSHIVPSLASEFIEDVLMGINASELKILKGWIQKMFSSKLQNSRLNVLFLILSVTSCSERSQKLTTTISTPPREMSGNRNAKYRPLGKSWVSVLVVRCLFQFRLK